MEYYRFQKKYPMLAHAVMLSHSDVEGAWQRVQREPGNGRQSESSGLLQTIKFVSSPIDSTFKYVFLNFGRHDKLSFSIGGT